MKNNRKLTIIFLALILMLSVFVATACSPARKPGPVQPSPTPAPTTPTPTPTPTTPTTDGTAQALAQKISAMKDINSASVVISGNSAWVGVDLAANLENKMTNKMKDEITTLVKKEDTKITTVYVTADADTVTRLKNIATDIASGKPISGFVNELNEMGRRITPSAK